MRCICISLIIVVIVVIVVVVIDVRLDTFGSSWIVVIAHIVEDDLCDESVFVLVLY